VCLAHARGNDEFGVANAPSSEHQRRAFKTPDVSTGRFASLPIESMQANSNAVSVYETVKALRIWGAIGTSSRKGNPFADELHLQRVPPRNRIICIAIRFLKPHLNIPTATHEQTDSRLRLTLRSASLLSLHLRRLLGIGPNEGMPRSRRPLPFVR